LREEFTRHSLLGVQANGADGFKQASIHISEKLNGPDARIVHTRHDEIIVEARDDIVDEVWAIVKGAREAVLERIIPEVAFTVQIRIADSWKG
jgi:DNA polymerase I-like protein with 3'-5' exonuclease and polymerase domains